MQKTSVSLIFCGRWNTSQLFVLSRKGIPELRSNNIESTMALILGGRLSSLVPETRALCFSDNDNISQR